MEIPEHKYKAFQRLLKKSSFLSLVANGPVLFLIWKYDTNWTIDFISPNSDKILGYSVELILANKIGVADLIHPDDIEMLRREINVQPDKTGGYTHHIPFRMKVAGNNWSWMQCHSTLEYDKQNIENSSILAYMHDVTLEKVVSKVLRENEEKFKLIINHSPIALGVFDTENRLVIASKKWYSIFSSDTNMIGYSFFSIFTELNQSWQNIFAEVLLGKPQKNDESLFVDNQKKELWIKWELQPWYNAKDEIGGSILFVEDISLSKKAKEDLVISHNTLTKILDSLNAAVYVSDMQTYEVLFVNQFLRKRYGDVEGLICWQVFQKHQNGPCTYCNNQKLINFKGESAGVINWEIFNQYEQSWYAISDCAIQWIDERLVRLEIAFDISEQKKIEQDLALRDQILRAVSKAAHILLESQNTHDAVDQTLKILGEATNVGRVYLFKKDYTTLEIGIRSFWSIKENSKNDENSSDIDFNNPIFEDWLESLEKDQIISFTISDHIPLLDEYMKKLSIKSILLVPIHLRNEWWGFIGFIECRHFRLWQETEKEILRSAAGIIGSAIYRKRYEDEIRELNVNLGARVRQELMQNREKDHLLMAQSRLAGLGEMIGNIAHQWRQPLTVLGLIVQNLKDDFDFKELTAEKMEKAEKEVMDIVKHMSRTIDDFRDFFKPNKEKIPFFIYKDSLSKVMGFVEARLKSHSVHAEVLFEEDIRINGYPNEYSQVFLNIINNSVDAFIERNIIEPKLSIFLKKRNNRSMLIIRDNAGGIKEDIIEKIFDPYFTTKEKGTGIGLYMSKMIIEEHMGGTLTAGNFEFGVEFRIEI